MKYDYEVYSFSELTIEDLMGEDWEVRLTKPSADEYNMQLLVGDEYVSIEAEGLHPDAIDSLAKFCKRFLEEYKGLNHGKE
jgi:hypothetical protein